MNTTTLAQTLKEKVDWNKYATLVNCVGHELNERKLRFDKSDLFERSLEIFSNKFLVYVDQLGTDHVLPDGTTIEMKYTEGSLFTKKNKNPKKFVADLQLMNSRGSSQGRVLPESYADYLLICDTHSAAIISKQDLVPFVVDAGDGLKTTKLPMEKVSMVFTPQDVLLNESVNAYSYKDKKAQMQMDFLAQF